MAYWYEGGRPSGCCGGFIGARDVVEAAGLPLTVVLFVGAAARVFTVGTELCDCEELMLLAADEAVPLVVGGAAFELGGERLVFEALEGVAEGLLLDLRVEPTSLRKRVFMEDMET